MRTTLLTIAFLALLFAAVYSFAGERYGNEHFDWNSGSTYRNSYDNNNNRTTYGSDGYGRNWRNTTRSNGDSYGSDSYGNSWERRGRGTFGDTNRCLGAGCR